MTMMTKSHQQDWWPASSKVGSGEAFPSRQIVRWDKRNTAKLYLKKYCNTIFWVRWDKRNTAKQYLNKYCNTIFWVSWDKRNTAKQYLKKYCNTIFWVRGYKRNTAIKGREPGPNVPEIQALPVWGGGGSDQCLDFFEGFVHIHWVLSKMIIYHQKVIVSQPKCIAWSTTVRQMRQCLIETYQRKSTRFYGGTLSFSFYDTISFHYLHCAKSATLDYLIFCQPLSNIFQTSQLREGLWEKKCTKSGILPS